MSNINRGLGLALSGGGLRGTAHIGVLKVLHEKGIYPEYIAGTSAGSIFAALHAAEVSPSEMEGLAFGLNRRDLMDWNINFFNGMALLWQVVKHIPKLMTLSPLGLIKGNRLVDIFEKSLKGMQLRDVPKTLAITATDINTGEMVVFTNSPSFNHPTAVVIDNIKLAQAVRASIAIPDIFTPMKIQGRTLVDGGLKENVPVRVLKALGAEKIIAVDLGYSGEEKKEATDMVEIFMRSLDILVRCNASGLNCLANVIITPRVPDYGLLEVDGVKECIRIGEEETRKALPAIMELLN